MKRTDIESIKNMCNSRDIDFMYGARQSVLVLLEYIDKLEERNKVLVQALNKVTKLRPIADIHEDYGDVLLWNLESGDPPDIGCSLDWKFKEEEYTHFSLIPPVELEGTDND